MNNNSISNSKKINWFGILIFMTIATIFSYFFRINHPLWFKEIELPYGLSPLKGLMGSFGVFLGAIIVMKIFPAKREITIYGTSKIYSLTMMLIPLLLFIIIGVPNDRGLNSHYFGFILGIQALLWVFLEEFGWRGYLQSELGSMKSVYKYIIIGCLWYLWHLWFLNLDFSNFLNFIVNLTINLSILIFASWGIGEGAKWTKSVMAASCYHLLGSLIYFNALLTKNVSSSTRWAIFVICVISWIIIGIFWIRKDLAEKESD